MIRRRGFAVLTVAAFAGAAVAADPGAPSESKTAEQIVPLVNQYCGACHAVPRPDILPKRGWPTVIRSMVGVMQERTGRTYITEAQMNDIIALYYGSSPKELPTLPYLEEHATTRRFVAQDIGALSKLPFVTNLNAVELTRGAAAEFLVCDGEAKRVLSLRKMRGRWSEAALSEVEIPVHTELTDLDADGDPDVLVADLGQFPPLKATLGKVFALRQVAPGKFQKELLLEGLGRVSDARAADLDADGDLDLAVAVFGGGGVGEVFWQENVAARDAPPIYRKHELLNLSGAINVTPVDLNADGRLDLVSLVAQEHEMIVAFVNLGERRFEQRVIARTSNPMYGSTGMSPVDLDRDGDLDILYTNGDAFDVQNDPKPYHGVQWLENRGGLEFEFHDIGRMYGVATAAAGDMDNDGDLDVVAGSWVNYWNDPRRHVLVWYENDGQQNFTPHGIASRPAGVASIQLSDVNGDGALDIVAGALRMDLLLGEKTPSDPSRRLFPPSTESMRHSRVIVFENRPNGRM